MIPTLNFRERADRYSEFGWLWERRFRCPAGVGMYRLPRYCTTAGNRHVPLLAYECHRLGLLPDLRYHPPAPLD